MIFCHFNHVSTRVSWKTSRLAAAPSLFGSSVESSKFTVYPKWIGFRHLQSRFCFNSKLNERQRRSERERERWLGLTFGLHWCSLVLSLLGWKGCDHCYRLSAAYSSFETSNGFILDAHTHTHCHDPQLARTHYCLQSCINMQSHW